MFENGTRIHGVAILIGMAFPLLGAAMALAEVTGRCQWIIRAGRAVIGFCSALLAGSAALLIVALAAGAIRMIVTGE
jgi:hypothetical protein